MTMREREPEPDSESASEPRYHADFRHPDGRWYRLWMTRTDPKTGRGHPWHVHASYDLGGTTIPSEGSDWSAQSYGVRNWDFYAYDEALAAFIERFQLRIDHGYTVADTNMTSSGDV
jgi:hypothetical protein